MYLSFVYLWGDMLYTEANDTLYVYSLGDLTSPTATYRVSQCYSALITDNRLYLGGYYELHIFEVNSSLTEPLTRVTKIIKEIPTESTVEKILRVGDDLLLG